MFNYLDEIEPVVEGSGSSINPFLVTGIVVGPLLLIFALVMLLKKK